MLYRRCTCDVWVSSAEGSDCSAINMYFLAYPCRSYPRRKLYGKYCRSHSGTGERRRQAKFPYFFCRVALLDMHLRTSSPSSIGSISVWSPLGRLKSRPITLFPLPISSHLLLVDNKSALGSTSNTPNKHPSVQQLPGDSRDTLETYRSKAERLRLVNLLPGTY